MLNILSCPSPYDKLQPVFDILVDLIGLLKIIVPIGLILYGMLDFAKAMVAKDEAEIKKAQGMFIKRLIYAIAIFFVITLVTLITKLVAKYVSDNTDVNAESWIDCFDLRSSGGGTANVAKYYNVQFISDAHGGLTGTVVFTVANKTKFSYAIVTPTPIAIPNDGYTFEKWSPSLPSKSATITKDVVYTAVYGIDENNNEIIDSKDTYYTVKFDKGSNGKLAGTTSFKVLTGLGFKNKVTIPTVTPNDGYTFEKWDPELPSDTSLVTNNITYKAIYKKNG